MIKRMPFSNVAHLNADFDEAKHKRGKDGKFTKGAGGGSKSKDDARNVPIQALPSGKLMSKSGADAMEKLHKDTTGAGWTTKRRQISKDAKTMTDSNAPMEERRKLAQQYIKEIKDKQGVTLKESDLLGEKVEDEPKKEEKKDKSKPEPKPKKEEKKDKPKPEPKPEPKKAKEKKEPPKKEPEPVRSDTPAAGSVEREARIGLKAASDPELKLTRSDVKQGEPMTLGEANSGNVNPNYSSTDVGYKINCQSCVMAMEYRLRGYDVTAINGKDRIAHELAFATATGAHLLNKNGSPARPVVKAGTQDNMIEALKKVQDRLDKRLPVDSARLQLIFVRMDKVTKQKTGHTLMLMYNRGEPLRVYDPQGGGDEFKPFTEYYVKREKNQKILHADVFRLDNARIIPKYEKVLVPNKKRA